MKYEFTLAFFISSLFRRELESFEWYQSYRDIRDVIHKECYYYKPKESTQETEKQSPVGICFPEKSMCRVLIVGCGNSKFGEDMIKDGWLGKLLTIFLFCDHFKTHILVLTLIKFKGGVDNVDYSQVVIDQMKEKYSDAFYRKLQQSQNQLNKRNEKLPKLSSNKTYKGKKTDRNGSKLRSIRRMTFDCVDVTDSLPFADRSYDVIICKGTLDSIMCSRGADFKVNTMMKECHRVLNQHGIFFIVSHGKPQNRNVYFEPRVKNDVALWSNFKVEKVPKGGVDAVLPEKTNPSM